MHAVCGVRGAGCVTSGAGKLDVDGDGDGDVDEATNMNGPKDEGLEAGGW